MIFQLQKGDTINLRLINAGDTVTAWMLIRLLSGVFDPPPESMSVPWYYLGFVHVMVIVSVAIAVIVTAAVSQNWNGKGAA